MANAAWDETGGCGQAPPNSDRNAETEVLADSAQEGLSNETWIDAHDVYSTSSWRGGGCILCVAYVRASRPRRSLGRLLYGEQSRDRVVARPGEEREIGVERQYGPSLPKHDRPCRDGCGGKRQVREVSDPGLGRENEGDDVRPAGPDVHAGPDAGRTQAHGRGKGGTDPTQPSGVEGTGRRLGRLAPGPQRCVAPAGIPLQKPTGQDGSGDHGQ